MTDVKTLPLADFLLARICEDEQSAGVQDPADDDRWRIQLPRDGWPTISPARVLAECEAKRRIVALHQPEQEGRHDTLYCSECDSAHEYASWPCGTLRLLALPYADHPDYRDEWRVLDAVG